MNPVFKFGGTSMGSLERIEHVADLCVKHRPSCVVVSAMAGETNRLVALARGISERTDVPEYDMLVASGEQVSVALLSLALRKRGIVPAPMIGSQAGIRTDSLFSRAQILSVSPEAITKQIARGAMPIIAGFQGVTEDGQFTSLGRGGSDTSAVAVTAGIGAKVCVIYTDVDGVFTTDPRICKNARIIRRINSEEMLEMASQGSKVLHIRSVQLAAKWGIRLFVKNTFSDDEGTEMTTTDSSSSHSSSGSAGSSGSLSALIEGEVVTGVACVGEEAWLRLGPMKNSVDALSNVFCVLSDRGVNVDIIGQNFEPAGLTVNFTIAQSDVGLAKAALAEHFSGVPLEARTDVGKVSIVGVGMRTHAGVAARMFRSLAAQNIEILLVTTSEIKVACLVLRTQVANAVNVLHREFIENE